MKKSLVIFAWLLSFSLLQASFFPNLGECPCKRNKEENKKLLLRSLLLSCCSCGDCETVIDEIPADTID